jgi:peptide/nickel transport system substrate-binding protein
MRRSKAVSVIALFAGVSLILGACGTGTDNSTGSQNQQQNQKPGEIGGEDKIFKRPTVQDAGDISYAVEENYHDYNNLIGATNSQPNLRVGSTTLPSVYIGVNVNGQIEPQIDGDLMESVKVTSTTPQVVEYKFQKAAVWEDGAPIGCKDLYLRWLTSATADIAGKFDSTPTGYENIDKMECKDEGKTAVATFSTPFADYRGLFSLIGNDGFLPAHVLEKKTGIADITKVTKTSAAELDKAADFYKNGWLGHNPEVALSGGPFRVKSTDLKDTTVLERNPKYWGPKAGPATLTIRTNTNAQSAAQQLQNKEVQVVDVQADGPTAIQLRGLSNVKTYAAGGQTYEHFDMNMSKPLIKDNPELRKAFATCVNRQSIIDNLVKDIDPNAKPLGNFMFMPNEVGYEDHYGDVGKGDADAAKKLMEGGGWTLGPDGVYTKNGVRAEFVLGYKTIDRRNSTWQLAAESCAKAGIKINSGQQANFNDDLLPTSQFDVALFAWVGGLTKSGSYGNYASKEKGGSANYNLYSNPKMDETYAAANKNLDFTSRMAQLNEVDKLMAADMHSIPLFQLPDFTAFDSSIGAMGADGQVGDLSYVNFAGGTIWNAFAWQKR